MCDEMSVSTATAPAHWAGWGAQTKLYCCSLTICLDDLPRTVGEPQSPAGHPVALAESVDHQRLRIELGRRHKLAIVAEGPVDLVTQQDNFPFGGQLGQPSNVFFRCNDAGWIGRTVEQDHLRLRRDRIGYPIQIDAEVGVSVDVDDLPADHRSQGIVHDEKRVEHDHFVARIDQGHHGEQQAATRSRCHEQLTIVMAVLFVDLLLKLLTQHGHALRQGVTILAALDRVGQPPGGLRAEHQNPVARSTD